MANDLLVLVANRAGTDITPEGGLRPKLDGNTIGPPTMAQPQFLGYAIVAKQGRPVIEQKLPYATGNAVGPAGCIPRRISNAEVGTAGLKCDLTGRIMAG